MNPQERTRPPRPEVDDDLHGVSTTTTAVALCLTPAIAWSMTPLQLQVFQQLCTRQMADGGPHSLLPQVMDGLLWVARRGWWDVGVVGIAAEG